MQAFIDAALTSLIGSLLVFFGVYSFRRKVKLSGLNILFAFLINWGAATIVSSLFGYSGNVVFIVLGVNIAASFVAIKMFSG